MATENLRPNANGSVQDITSQFPDSGFHFDKVDEVIADETDTTVFVNSIINVTDLYELPNTSARGTINSVTVWVRCLGGVFANIRQRILTYGTQYTGAWVASSTSWTSHSYEWTTNPNTGVAWTATELNNLEIGVEVNDTNGEIWRATQIWAAIDYTPFIPKVVIF